MISWLWWSSQEWNEEVSVPTCWSRLPHGPPQAPLICDAITLTLVSLLVLEQQQATLSTNDWCWPMYQSLSHSQKLSCSASFASCFLLSTNLTPSTYNSHGVHWFTVCAKIILHLPLFCNRWSHVCAFSTKQGSVLKVLWECYSECNSFALSHWWRLVGRLQKKVDLIRNI